MVRSLWIEYMYISASLPSYALHFTVKNFPIHATLISECFKNVLFTSLKPCQDSQPKLISSHKHAYQPSLKRLWATLPLANRLKLSFLGLEGEVHFLDTNDRFDAFALKMANNTTLFKSHRNGICKFYLLRVFFADRILNLVKLKLSCRGIGIICLVFYLGGSFKRIN